MKVILTHTARTMDEIVGIVRDSGSFTAPVGLPHYRYDRTKHNLAVLQEAGILRCVARHGIQAHYSRGANFERTGSGLTAREVCNIIKKERKAANPPKPKRKSCCGCGCQFETLNFEQKFCQKECRPKWAPGISTQIST